VEIEQEKRVGGTVSEGVEEDSRLEDIDLTGKSSR
jgi:hypothetical protein